mgnify:CR=1 FL=1
MLPWISLDWNPLSNPNCVLSFVSYDFLRIALHAWAWYERIKYWQLNAFITKSMYEHVYINFFFFY